MPPAPLRRPLTITTWLVISTVCLALSPLLLLIAAIIAAIMHRPEPLLLTRLLIAYFERELGVLLACGALWLLSGFGARLRSPRFQRLHYRLLRWFVHGLSEHAKTVLHINVIAQPTREVTGALQADRPLLFFSRHAGPGDTVLLTDLLLSRYRRTPSVVFKNTLALDSTVDLIGHRLPHAVLDTSDPPECEARIQTVTGKLGPRGVLILFPEGGNFTAERRRAALRKLWRKGLWREAAAARQMPHVLPPHSAGALAALRGCPECDVIFSAHTGLGLGAFPGELWRHAPIGETLKTRMWLSPAAERPADPDHQVQWLYDWWKRIDEWVDSQDEVAAGGAG
jgi:acyltransferase-like protein